MDNCGFTIIELSVVLVIIGLLIGGILAAQSMINTSKINSFVKQMQQMDTSLSNFRVKFNSLPGDSTVMTNPGDGSGRINHMAASTTGYSFSGEIPHFWPHLSISGFDPHHQYSATVIGSFNANPDIMNAPFAKIGDKASILPITTSFTNWGRILAYKISNTQLVTNAATSVFSGDINATKSLDIAAIDKKIDDGNLASVEGSSVYGLYYTPSTVSFVDCTNAMVKCVLYVKALSQIGEPAISY